MKPNWNRPPLVMALQVTKCHNQNWTWGELELYQDFFQILIPILRFREFFVFLKDLKLLLHLLKEA
jgi:hypothetical protein